MVRYYDYRIIVKNVPRDKEKEVKKYIATLVEEMDDYSYDKFDKSIFCLSTTCLCAGTSPEQAHKNTETVIKQIVPGAVVITKWHIQDSDEPSWGDTYGE